MNERASGERKRAGCPAPEQLLRLLGEGPGGALEAVERERLQSHLEACGACSAELLEMRGMQVGPTEVERMLEEAGDGLPLQRVEPPENLGRSFRRAAEGPAARGWPRRRPPGPLSLRPVLLAAAVLLAILLLIPFWNRLTGGGGKPVYRGMEEETSARILPQGRVEEVPPSLNWTPVAGASVYRLELFTGALEPLWSAETPGTSVALPEDVRARLGGSGRCLTRVTAFSRAPLIDHHQLAELSGWLEIAVSTDQ